jgi:hypothetical protein
MGPQPLGFRDDIVQRRRTSRRIGESLHMTLDQDARPKLAAKQTNERIKLVY